MRKKVFAVLLSVTLAITPAVSVFAEDITVTVPYYGNETDDEEVPDAKGIEVNPDGSTTYTLDTDQQEKWKASIKSDFDNNIKEILDDDTNYPNVEDITYNDDMTEFNITLSSVNLSSSEFFIGFLPLFVAPIYQQLNGVAKKDVDYTLKVTDSSSEAETTQNYEENKSDWDSFMSSMNGDYSDGASTETLELPGGDYEDMGTGTICLYTPGGSSENGNVPIIFIDGEALLQIGLDSLDFDGSKLSYIYVDGMLVAKEQLANSQISLDLSGDMLSVGTHTVQVVQYNSDDSSGEMITYKSANYETKNK